MGINGRRHAGTSSGQRAAQGHAELLPHPLCNGRRTLKAGSSITDLVFQGEGEYGTRKQATIVIMSAWEMAGQWRSVMIIIAWHGVRIKAFLQGAVG